MSDSTEAITVSRMTLLTLTGSRSQDPRAKGPRIETGTRHRLAWPSPT
jgi:hypothetical protein